jgi:long-chain acyl-CoA synthetase
MGHIAAGLIAQAQRQPHQLAIVVEQERTVHCCYGELLDAAQRVAIGIAPFIKAKTSVAENSSKLNPAVRQRVRVGLVLSNRLEFLEIFLGVTIAGGIAMVFDPKWAPPQMQQAIMRAAPDLLFVEAEWVEPIGQLFKGLPLVAVPKLAEGQTSAIAVGYDQWCQGLHTDLNRQTIDSTCFEELSVSDDAFYVGFTSGTTGIPKGVVRSHLSWVNSFAASQAEFGTCAADRILVPGSLTHSLSLYAALECLNAGATLYLLPKFSAKAVVRLLTTQSITVLTAVPTLLKSIAKFIITKSLSCSTLRAVIAGGSKLELSLRSELPLAFPTAEILEYFGALELSFVSLAASREGVPSNSVGRSFHGVELSIRRPQGTGEATAGEVGWIGVKSQLLSLGYLETEQETTYRVLEGWATVGDLGWQDANGYLYLTGREQDMIVSGGMNVYPAEIETILRKLPEISEVVVVGMPDEQAQSHQVQFHPNSPHPNSPELNQSHQAQTHRGQLICAAIQWVSEPLPRAELLHYLHSYLPSAKCPRYFITVDQFPTTQSGKVMRSVLQKQVMSQLFPSVDQKLGSDRTSADDVPGSGATPNQF